MYGITDPVAFVIAVVLFLAIPGPSSLTVLGAAGQHGWRAGLKALLGVIAGDQVLIWAALAGVATLLLAAPALFKGVQWAGAAYLAWMGIRMIRARAKEGDVPAADAGPPRPFRQAALVTLLNPKGIVFYMAFFPLFIDTATHRGLPSHALMAGAVAVLTAVHGSLGILLVHLATAQLKARPGLVQAVRRCAGVCLLGFGIKIATGS